MSDRTYIADLLAYLYDQLRRQVIIAADATAILMALLMALPWRDDLRRRWDAECCRVAEILAGIEICKRAEARA